MTKRKITSACRTCGAPFPTNKTQKYCSLRCGVEDKVDKGPLDQCWPWTGAVNSMGYGQIRFGGKVYYGHRLMYEYAYAPLGEQKACHRCDNPICCNPHHIFAGSQADNLADMRRKGRGHKFPAPGFIGRDHFNARFTAEDFAMADALRKQGLSYREIGRRLGMSKTTARKAHLANPQ